MTTHQLIAQTFQRESGRVLATLYATLHDFELAEDALQDALLIALEHWPQAGAPRNPGAWITTIARRKAIDRLRRDQTFARHHPTIEALTTQDHDLDEDHQIPDERLKLMFTCCHPALAKEAQVALTLQTLGGLSTVEIAHAFLVPPPTMAQRLVRAKRKIRDAGIPYQVPPPQAIADRIDAVLTVLYLIFNAGYNAPVGLTPIRADLCQEAIRLNRVLVKLIEQELRPDAEAIGLLALMLLHYARFAARLGPQGEVILLEDQDRHLWDQTLIQEGVSLLEQAFRLGDVGYYQIQAAISALHAQAPTPDATDWPQIAALYRVLQTHFPSSVVDLNAAVAIAMSEGVAAGLAMIHMIEARGELQDYFWFYVAKADLLRRSDNLNGALIAYQHALTLTQNAAEQTFLKGRIAELC
ncbi:MAG: RNA polymerase sigma factor [Anaerolineae bacterium]|jgi:RNA polymerase sigma-70 factor (ECF subfamily)|nr:RNA polymerase sigma factor [Anaerolineae bacterium]